MSAQCERWCICRCTLHDQDIVRVGDIEEFNQVLLHIINDIRGQLAAMAMFCHAPRTNVSILLPIPGTDTHRPVFW